MAVSTIGMPHGAAARPAVPSPPVRTAPTTPAAARFIALLDEERVIDRPLELGLYGRDGSIAQGRCGLAVLPETTEEVVACMRLAAELDLKVVPRGSGTGLAGGAVPLEGALVLSLARMRRILRVDPAVPCALVEPGVLNLDLTEAVRHLGLHYAPDPSSQAACSIGGNVATNAGGPHCLSAGVTSPARPGPGDGHGRRRGARARRAPRRTRPATTCAGSRSAARARSAWSPRCWCG